MSPPRLAPRPNPAKVLTRAALLFLGIGVTWLCAAFGLFVVVSPPHGCTSRTAIARGRVLEISQGIAIYKIEHHRCPATRDDLIAGRILDVRGSVDPWATPIAFHCTADDTLVTSAGPDRVFGTDDDISNEL
jgi:hypothetical protein